MEAAAVIGSDPTPDRRSDRRCIDGWIDMRQVDGIGRRCRRSRKRRARDQIGIERGTGGRGVGVLTRLSRGCGQHKGCKKYYAAKRAIGHNSGPPVRFRRLYGSLSQESLTRQPTAPFVPQFIVDRERRCAFVPYFVADRGDGYQSWFHDSRSHFPVAVKQMGPALLPTPLSPMRGHVRRRELGIRCFPF